MKTFNNFEVQLQLSTMCNNSCVYCDCHSSNIKFKYFKRLFKFINNHNKLKVDLILTGGEPTLLNIKDIIQQCRDNIHNLNTITLNSNCQLKECDFYNNLNIDYILISLHIEYINDITEWFENIKKIKIDKQIALMYTNENARQIEHMYNKYKYKFNDIFISPIFDTEVLNDYTKVDYLNSSFKNGNIPEKYKKVRNFYKKYKCWSSLIVLANGDIIKCWNDKTILGNINTDIFKLNDWRLCTHNGICYDGHTLHKINILQGVNNENKF